MKPKLLLIGSSLVALYGCTRVSVTTNIGADGSFTRTATYSAMKMDPAMTGALGGAPANGQEKAEGPEDYFLIPRAVPGITVTKKSDTGQTAVVVQRAVSAGSQPMQDIVLVDTAKKPLLTSTVAVRRQPENRIEYIETLHWTGPAASALTDITGDVRQYAKKHLPQRFQDTQTIDKVSRLLGSAILHAFFGPPDPMLATLVADPDLLAHKLMAQAYSGLSLSLVDQLGISPDEARSLAHNILADMPSSQLGDKMNPNKKLGAPGNSPDDRSETPLTFAVKFPGKIVKTDGLVDPVSGEVYWSLNAAATQFGDVKLDLLVDTSK